MLTNAINLEAVDRELGNAEGWWEGFDFKTPTRGVTTHIVAAFDPALKGTLSPFMEIMARPLPHTACSANNIPEHNGQYLQDGHIADPYVETIKPYALDKVEADRLWKLSEELVGQNFDY